MKDFTLATCNKLLDSLKTIDYDFQPFSDFVTKSVEKGLILRHDVDKLPENSLVFAKTEAEKGIRGTYYFRAVQDSWNERIIKDIASLGHEIGYHYEDVSLAAERQKIKVERQKEKNIYFFELQDRKTARLQDNERIERKLAEIAKETFKSNLKKLQELAPVKTICMHGSPMSRWDSRLLWKYYDYHDFGIVGEPYFDIDFDQVLYLTDTGRCWDGQSVSIRDKATGFRHQASGENPYKGWKVKPVNYRSKFDFPPSSPLPLSPSSYCFHSTSDLIKAAEEHKLPDRIMITFHPQRWTDNAIPWVKELLWQNVKNIGKYLVAKRR